VTRTSDSTVVAVVTSDDIKRLATAFPLVVTRGGDDVEALARAAGVPLATAQAALSDPTTAVLLLDAQSAAEDDGRLLKPVAARVALAMLTKLRDEVDAGHLDADDIGNLLPKVHRVVEHADRIEAARDNGYSNLPMVHITIGRGIQIDMQKPATPADVIDIDAAEVPE
jgi:hypothetical protein